jgi:hypothetical protein
MVVVEDQPPNDRCSNKAGEGEDVRNGVDVFVWRETSHKRDMWCCLLSYYSMSGWFSLVRRGRTG